MPDATPRMTVEEYRALVGQAAPQPTAPTKRAACPGCERLLAFLLLLRMLMADSRVARMELEYHFHPTRRWRADLAIWLATGARVLLEIDGGGWVGGAHHRPLRRDADNERDAAAQELGWRVLRVTHAQVADGTAFERIMRVAGSEISPEQPDDDPTGRWK